MSAEQFLAELANRGLTAWQATFVASFFNSDTSVPQPPLSATKSALDRPASHLLIAPPGTGKAFAASALVGELTARGAQRILILAPAPSCEAWREGISEAQPAIPVLVVARRSYREMVAAVPLGHSPWAASGVFILSQDFAKQADVAEGLSAVVWDLVAVDEAHRLAAQRRIALIDRLNSSGAIRRLLLLTASPLPELQDWLGPTGYNAPLWAPSTITTWSGLLRNWDGSVVYRPRFDWETVRYTRAPDETRFILKLREVAVAIASAFGNPLVSQVLEQRAASSTFAADLSLQRLSHTLRSRATGVSTLTNSDSDVDLDSPGPGIEQVAASGLRGESAALKAIDECVEALESVNTDEKLNALKGLLWSIAETSQGLPLRVCILSKYADTVAYLHSALHGWDTPVTRLTGRDGFSDRMASVQQFRAVGGVLIATDNGISGEIDLGEVNHAIHYDLAQTAEAVELRRDKVDRHGRTGSLIMYTFLDDSGAVPGEVEMSELLNGLRRRLEEALSLADL